MRGGERPVTFSAAKWTLPWVGFRTPVIRLNSVDLPAPFGPITARTSPSSTCIDTWSTATRPPKRRVSSSSSSNATAVCRFGGTAEAGAREAPDPLRREDHECNKDQAEKQGPGLGVIAELVLDHQKKCSAKNRADQRA